MSYTTLQDTITLQLTRETVVVNDTVRVVATIAALVQPTQSDAELRQELRDTMKAFVQDAEWQFSNMFRVQDDTGIERLTVTATARVSEKENSNLELRAKTVSRPGLTISNVMVDTSIPQAKIDDATQKLRTELLIAAREEAARATTALQISDVASFHNENTHQGERYRVHNISFQNGSGQHSNARIKSAALVATSYGSGFSDAVDEDEALGNAQKIVMTANITLAVAVPLGGLL